jgi:hypothetical protein
MEYLVYTSKEGADKFSKEEWEVALGRPKNPRDVTEFLWGRRVGKDGRVAVQVEKEEPVEVPQGRDGEPAPELLAALDDNWAPPVYPKNG